MASRIDADQRAVLRGRTPDRIEYLHAGQSVGEGRRLDRRRIGRSVDGRAHRVKQAREVGETDIHRAAFRSEEHKSELQSLMRSSYAVFCLDKYKQRQYISYCYRLHKHLNQMQKN